MARCKSGKHEWIDDDCAKMCCNGYHREFRIGSGFMKQDEIRGVTYNDIGKYVWVKDK